MVSLNLFAAIIILSRVLLGLTNRFTGVKSENLPENYK